MRKSTRFPAAVHIMTMLAAKSDGYMSSGIIAGSMNTNRVVVRRLLATLADAGLVSFVKRRSDDFSRHRFSRTQSQENVESHTSNSTVC